MERLIELREKARVFYSKYSLAIRAIAKFLMAFCTFLIINKYVGYFKALDHAYVALALALLCAVLPLSATLALGAVLTILHLYALSMQMAVIAVALFALIFLLYFRFSPKETYYVLLMLIAFVAHVPYAVPVAAGLLGGPASMAPILCGTVLYFFLNGLYSNAALFLDAADGDAVSPLNAVANQFLGNKEMYLLLFAFLLAVVLVYAFRRRPVDHAWSIAISIGILSEFAICLAGYFIMGISGKIPWLLFGTLVSAAIALVLEFLFFNLDYSRTERVQFEDDEYYYYVKAVPKISMSSGNKQVKKIAPRRGNKRPANRKPTNKKNPNEKNANQRNANPQNANQKNPSQRGASQQPGLHGRE